MIKVKYKGNIITLLLQIYSDLKHPKNQNFEKIGSNIKRINNMYYLYYL